MAEQRLMSFVTKTIIYISAKRSHRSMNVLYPVRNADIPIVHESDGVHVRLQSIRIASEIDGLFHPYVFEQVS